MTKVIPMLVLMILFPAITFAQTANEPQKPSSSVCSAGEMPSGDLGYSGTECHGCSMSGKHILGEPDIEFTGEPILSGIRKGGPADGKLEEGDVLVAIDGEPITARAAAIHLSWLKPGELVRLTVRRKGVRTDVEVTPTERCRRVSPTVKSPSFEQLLERRKAGKSLDSRVSIGLGLRTRGSWDTPPEVVYVAPDSPGEQAGLKPGDLLVAINGVALKSLPEGAPLRNIKPNQQVTLLIIRDATPIQLTLTAGSH